MPHIFRPRKDPIILPIQMSCWGIIDSSRADTLFSKPQRIDTEAHLHPCLLTQKVRKCVTKLQSPHSHSIPQSTHKLVSMDQPGSQAVEILHIYIAVILSLSLYVQNFWQRSLKAFCLSSLGFGLGLALQKVTFTFLPQMMETLKVWIMSLHPLPFTPAKVFFISLGRLNFPHVVPSSSSRLPRASHNQPVCLGGGKGWGCWNVHQIWLWLCLSDPAWLLWLKQRTWLFRWPWAAYNLPIWPEEMEPSSLLCLSFTALGPGKDSACCASVSSSLGNGIFVSHGTLCILQQSLYLWFPV